MTIVKKTVEFDIDIDTDEIAPVGVYAFIYQFLNRLDYEHDITRVKVDGKEVDTTVTPVEELELGDNEPLIDDKDRE